jgi:hypothetical protein
MTVRAHVERYITRGLRPIPMFGVDGAGRCRCGGSECNAGKHCTDQVEARWKDGPPFGAHEFDESQNVAIALGPWRPGAWLVCLDVDGVPDLSPFVPFLLPPLPPTLTQKSPRGLHLFFQVPERTPLGNWVDVFATKARGYALDLRYARGKVNVAPSRSAFGDYRWTDEREPEPLPQVAISTILNVRRSRGLPVQRIWERGESRR